MIDNLTTCPKCKAPESCYIQDINETKKAYNCFNCGFFANDMMIEGDFDFASFEETMPELYKDIKYIDEQKRVWYPNVINTPEKGVVFVNGKSKDDWQWASIKSMPLTKKEMKMPRFKGQSHKSDPKSLQNHGQDGFFDACDELGLFDIENTEA
jgi:hypothetical protein